MLVSCERCTLQMDRVQTLLAENHALRSVMLQELTEPELEPLLIKPVGTREVTVNILRSEYNLDTLPNQLPTSEIVLWLERCKEDAEVYGIFFWMNTPLSLLVIYLLNT